MGVARETRLTCALGAGDEGGAGFPGAALPGACEQDADLVLGVGVEVPQLVVRRVDGVRLGPGARGHAVLHLLQDDRPVPEDGVRVQLDQQVGGADAQQLGRSYGPGWLCEKGRDRRGG